MCGEFCTLPAPFLKIIFNFSFCYTKAYEVFNAVYKRKRSLAAVQAPKGPSQQQQAIPFFPPGVYGAREPGQGFPFRSNERGKERRALDPAPSPLLSCFQLWKK
jgi:hypothetical protein